MSSDWNSPIHPSGVQETNIRLPANFTPSQYSVLVGRGKVRNDAMGNRRLKVLVGSFLNEYAQAARIEKSIIVSKIIDIVNDACPKGGGFVKFEGGVWWQVANNLARDRVGSLLRNALHDQYKSSSKSKRARRLERTSSSNTTGKKKAPPAAASPGVAETESSAVSSTTQGAVHNHQHLGIFASRNTTMTLDDPISLPSSTASSLSSTYQEGQLTKIGFAAAQRRRLPSQAGYLKHASEMHRSNDPTRRDMSHIVANANLKTKPDDMDQNPEWPTFEGDPMQKHGRPIILRPTASSTVDADPNIAFQLQQIQQLQHLQSYRRELHQQHFQLQQQLEQVQRGHHQNDQQPYLESSLSAGNQLEFNDTAMRFDEPTTHRMEFPRHPHSTELTLISSSLASPSSSASANISGRLVPINVASSLDMADISSSCNGTIIPTAKRRPDYVSPEDFDGSSG
jgi:hypothetical protein